MMEKTFNFEELAGYELYHLRYGKGAVIIAIPKENDEELIAIWDQYEKKAAEDSRSKMKPIKQKISDLKADLGEAFRVRIQKKEKSMSQPNYTMISSMPVGCKVRHLPVRSLFPTPGLIRNSPGDSIINFRCMAKIPGLTRKA